MTVRSDQIIGGNARLVRSINRSGILNIIREQQPISRIAISKITGLNKSTVSSIVNELLDQELIYEELVHDKNIGRNPIQLKLRLGKHYVGAINIDSTLSRLAIVDIDGSVVKKNTIKTDTEHPCEFVKQCAKQLTILQKGLAMAKFEGIGVSVAGIVDSKRKYLINAPNLGWKDFDIGQVCCECFDNNITINFENDAKSSALAELWFGTGEIKNIFDFVFVSVGIGIGTGIVVGKKLLDGYTHAAGEFGHLILFPEGEYCACGNQGCFEAYASDRASVRRYNRMHKYGPPETLIENIIIKAKGGDDIAIQSLQETGKYLGLGIAEIIKAIDPEAIVIGGKIISAWDAVYPEIMKVVKEQVLYNIEHQIKILPSSLKVRPRLLGAATLALKEIFSDYKIVR